MSVKFREIQKKWLITGGCGFIGTSLVKHLIKNEYYQQIRILDNLSVGTKSDLSRICGYSDFSNFKENSEGVFLTKGDILDTKLCIEASKGVDCIVHLAANTGVGPSVENPRKDMETNVIGTFNILEAARINGVKQFVFASSGAPAGEIILPIHEEIAPHPVSPYGSSKLAGEAYCSSYARTFGINTVALRFGNVYGPGSRHKSSVVAKFIKNVLAGMPCEIYGDGTQTRDFIFIHDLVIAIIKTSQIKMGGEVFQIASSSELSILELAEKLKEIFKEFGYEMRIEFGEKREGDVMRNYSDTSKAFDILEWEAETTLKSGLEQTINDLISRS